MNSKAIYRLLAAILMLTVAFTAAAQKEEKPKPRFADSETRKVKAFSKAYGDKLKPINQLLSPEECQDGAKNQLSKDACDRLVTGNYPKALPLLQRMEKSDKWKSHELAHLFGTMAYVYYQTDNTKRAISYYIKATNEEDINPGVYKNTLRTIGQLYIILEDYRNAIKYLKLWMQTQETVDASAYYQLASSYYNLDEYDNSLKNIEIAINIEEEKNGIAKENWYGIQRVIYSKRKNYTKVVQILKKLIVHFPKVNYWLEIGGMYAELEQDEKRHAAYDLVHLMKGLDNESRLMGLAYMYISYDVPYRAGQIINQGMKDGIIERTVKNLQVVGSAYYRSRDYLKAVPFLEQAAKSDESGESYARLTGVFTDLQRYRDAIKAGKEALKKGDIKRPDLLKLSIGTSYFNLREYDQALKMFQSIKATKVKRSRDSWIRHVRNEIKREKQLRASGIDLNKIYSTTY